MTYGIRILVGLSIVLTLAFVLRLGPPWRSANAAGAWLWALMGWTSVAFDTILLLTLLHIPVPAGAALLVLLVQDGVYAWRLFRLETSRRNNEEEVHR